MPVFVLVGAPVLCRSPSAWDFRFFFFFFGTGTLTAGQFGIFDTVMNALGASKFHFHDPDAHHGGEKH